MRAGMTTARICGLKGSIYYHRRLSRYVWNVTFEGAATSIQKYWIMEAGKDDEEEEVKKYQEEITKKLGELEIFNGNKVAILFDSQGEVFAIASLGKDKWVSIKYGNFVIRSFGDFNVTSLKVY